MLKSWRQDLLQRGSIPNKADQNSGQELRFLHRMRDRRTGKPVRKYTRPEGHGNRVHEEPRYQRTNPTDPNLEKYTDTYY